jgi:pimeloyl-ACP methyl ester carboxylesterase
MPARTEKELSRALELWRSSGEYLQHNGHEIFFRRSEPSAEPTVCLHGFPTSSYDYRKIWDEMSDHFPMLAFDMLGYGFSAKPRSADYTISLQADVVESVMAAAGATRVHILSHDQGNTITQELLARREEGRLRFDIASICFMNGALFPEVHKPLLAQKLLISPLGAVFAPLVPDRAFINGLSSIFGARTKPTENDLANYAHLLNLNGGKALTPKLMRYMRDRAANRDRWVGAMTRMDMPYMLINGSADAIAGKHVVERFREVVDGNAKVVELPEIGHFPHLEAPADVIESFLKFRTDVQAAAARKS